MKELNETQKLVVRTIKSLSVSQGFYSRLWADLQNAMSEGVDLSEFWAQFEGCKTSVDIVLALEQ